MESVEYLGFLIEVVSPEAGTYEYSVFDMTGKDKPKFSVFETDDVEFVSYEAAVDAAKGWIRDFLFLDDDRAVEHIEKLYATKKALSSSPSMETTGRVLPKLTEEVFNRPDCPKWAQYAAVDMCGVAHYYDEKPHLMETFFYNSSAHHWTIDGDFDATGWKNSLIERPALPKLTVDVFNRPDCPAWANYAVVNSRGTLMFFGEKPHFEGEDYGCWSCSGYTYKHINGAVFDASDWESSLIERPEENTLPDWCKVDAVGWHKRCGYFKVTYIDDVSKRVDIQQVEDKSKGYLSFRTVCKETVQAHFRPYNADEMKALVGKALKTSDGDLQLITAYYNDSERVLVGGLVDRSADEIKERYIHLDGSPCGFLEHLNEKGEWVE